MSQQNETQSVENGRHIAKLEGKFDALNDSIAEMHSDVKELVKRGERIKALEVASEKHEGDIKILKTDVLALGKDIHEINNRTNRLFWIVGSIYSVIVFIITVFGTELKEHFFGK